MGVTDSLVLGLLALFANEVISEKKVVCYYGTWATYRAGLGKFDVDHVDVNLCTHLIYTFVGINSQGTVVSLDPYLDLPDNWGRNNFGTFNALKQKNPNLKTILAVGGWNEGSAKYSIMAASAALRHNFVSSALAMVLQHGFDGLDVDWEYPARRDSALGRADVDNFTQLLRELHAQLAPRGLLLTAAVAAVGDMAVLSYDVPAISEYLDFISLMTYDMYGAWDPVTGHNAPLHAGEGDAAADRQSLYTVDVAVEYWLAQGCPPEKLVLGVPLYGRTFTLTNADVNSVRAPSSGAGLGGPYTVSPGSIGYNEFCDMLRTQHWTIRYDEQAKVPYAVQGRNWVTYDDPDSITKKVEYALQNNLAGVMVWSIETDDFHGLCSDEDFPLLRAINKALGKTNDSKTTTSVTESATSTGTTPVSTSTTSVSASTTTVSTSTTNASPTSVSPSTTETIPEIEEPESSICKEEGYAVNPGNCSSFFMCIRNQDLGLVAKEFECPSGLHWDQHYLFCNYADSVKCSV